MLMLTFNPQNLFYAPGKELLPCYWLVQGHVTRQGGVLEESPPLNITLLTSVCLKLLASNLSPESFHWWHVAPSALNTMPCRE